MSLSFCHWCCTLTPIHLSNNFFKVVFLSDTWTLVHSFECCIHFPKDLFYLQPIRLFTFMWLKIHLGSQGTPETVVFVFVLLLTPQPQSLIWTCPQGTCHHMLSLQGKKIQIKQMEGIYTNAQMRQTTPYCLRAHFCFKGGGVPVIPFQEIITSFQGGLGGREPLLVDSDRSGRMGLYVSLSFSQRFSLQEPLDLLSCKCAVWAAFRQRQRICLNVTLCLRFVETFWGYCDF